MNETVAGIQLADLEVEYERRGIGTWSDARLVRSVAAVLAEPRRDPADSFVLHAPLELAARAALLPHVAEPARRSARLHILAVAAQYEAFGDPAGVDPDPGPPPRTDDPVRWLLDAVAAGDLEGVDRAATTVARHMTADDLVAGIGDAVVPLTAAAAHAPIFLFHLLLRDPRGGVSPSLLRPLARELARRPEWRIAWVDEWRAAEATDGRALGEALATTPRLGVPGSTFIHPLMMQVDESGSAQQLLAPVLGRYDAAAARTVMRTAATSMLLDAPDHAPYGWSHCLTIPQAVVGIAPVLADPDRALAVAATQVVAFRAALGAADLPHAPTDLPTVDPTDLVTAAATSHDAHVVKYTLASLDAASVDPEAASLYLAAAQYLLDWWTAAGGDPSDPLT